MKNSRLTIKDLRISFHQDIWTAKALNEGDKKSYGCQFIVPKDHPQIKEIQDAIDAVGKTMWPNDWARLKPTLIAQERIALKEAGNKPNWGAPYNDKNFYLVARRQESQGPVVIIDRDRTRLTEADGKIYSGCHTDAQVEFYAQNHPKGGKRVNCGLVAIQFRKNDTAFGGGAPANIEAFEDLSGEDEDEESLS